MQSILEDLINQFGYFAIVFLIALENIFPPIPSEVILTFGGFMTAHTEMSIFGVIIASTVGSVGGAIVLYYLGSILGKERMKRIVLRYGKWLRVTENDIEKSYNWFGKYGGWTVFFCRFVPLIRSLISIPAGMSKMSMPLFIVLTTIGTLIWNTVLVYLGASVGENWEDIVSVMDVYSNVAYVIIAVAGIAFLIWFFYYRPKKKARS
ncbi:DedA family protein [Jeotgalicoccus huakuii]|nr:DedA family protein [Jeotgalicoccus huakuii]